MGGLGGFDGLGGSDGCGHGLGAAQRSGCLLAFALVSIGSQFAWGFLGGVRLAVRWRCPHRVAGSDWSLQGATLGGAVGLG